MTDTLRVTHDGPVATVHLARPELHNAFNARMIAELHAVFAGLGNPDADAPRVIVLRGDGPSFSAGADLDWMREAADAGYDENVSDALRLADMLSQIRGCPRPVVARVHGAAMGGGVGLVAACDIAVAERDTRFAFSEVRLGLVPAVISPFVIPRIGVSAARELFLTGERFTAERAERIGLITRAVPPGDLDEAIDERVRALLQGAPEAQGAVKLLIGDLARGPEGTRKRTARLIAERRASEEGRSGMEAFLARRTPNWAPRERGDDG